MLKSGVAVPPQLGNLKFAMRVFQLKVAVGFDVLLRVPERAVVDRIDLHGAVVAPIY